MRLALNSSSTTTVKRRCSDGSTSISRSPTSVLPCAGSGRRARSSRGARCSSAAGVSRTGTWALAHGRKRAAWRRACRAEQGLCPAERDACRRTKAGRLGGAGTSKPSSPARHAAETCAGLVSSGPSEISCADVHCCAQRSRSALVASASASAFHFRGTHEILMLGNSWSREHASVCRGLRCSLRTFARPFNWSTTSSESRNTRMRWIPRLRASLSPSMRARYSATVLMAGPIVWRSQQLGDRRGP
jgi:hypothetical protein